MVFAVVLMSVSASDNAAVEDDGDYDGCGCSEETDDGLLLLVIPLHPIVVVSVIALMPMQMQIVINTTRLRRLQR